MSPRTFSSLTDYCTRPRDASQGDGLAMASKMPRGVPMEDDNAGEVPLEVAMEDDKVKEERRLLGRLRR